MKSLLPDEDHSLFDIGQSEIVFLGKKAMIERLGKLYSIPSVKTFLFPILVKELGGKTMPMSIALLTMVSAIERACDAENQVSLWPEVRRKALRDEVIPLMRAMTPNKNETDRMVRSNFFKFHKAYFPSYHLIYEAAPKLQKKVRKKREIKKVGDQDQLEITLPGQ
ncbi:hypothetical protein KBD81_06095 [Candidatus Woesebacteria bacterium]|nr:hypothetical protein [Candidatus Woesebacteria bacterium]